MAKIRELPSRRTAGRMVFLLPLCMSMRIKQAHVHLSRERKHLVIGSKRQRDVRDLPTCFKRPIESSRQCLVDRDVPVIADAPVIVATIGDHAFDLPSE